MKKLSSILTTEEYAIVSIALEEMEQCCWSLEKTDDGCLLCGYFENDYEPTWNDLQRKISILQNKNFEVIDIQESDWKNNYKQYLKPFKIGPLHIVPLWEKNTYKLPKGEYGVYLDADMAFGTGAHETTQLCLARAVEYHGLFARDLFAKQVIDVGCGSGILSIAAAKLGFPKVYGFDIDPDAIVVSKRNAEINQTSDIEFAKADIKAGILGWQGDLIMANVLAPVLIENASILVNTVKRYGCLSLSGILSKEVDEVKEVFLPVVKRYWDSFLTNTKILGQWAEIAYVRT